MCSFAQCNVPSKRSWCTVDLCPACSMWNHVRQKPAPLHPGHSYPSSQVTTDSVSLQPSRGMDLDSAHPGNSGAAWSMIRGYGIVYVYIVLYFPSSNTVSWNTLQIVYPHSIDCYYLLGWLTKLQNKSFHVHSSHFLGCVTNTPGPSLPLWKRADFTGGCGLNAFVMT
jgi:hypothetical protein